jgi:hypothetical protein
MERCDKRVTFTLRYNSFKGLYSVVEKWGDSEPTIHNDSSSCDSAYRWAQLLIDGYRATTRFVYQPRIIVPDNLIHTRGVRPCPRCP